MRDEDKTKRQLIDELEELRAKIAGQVPAYPTQAFAEDDMLSRQIANNERNLSILLEMIPGGVSIATDVSCREIRHSSVAAKFLRIRPWESLSHSGSYPLGLKVLRNGVELIPAQMPMQRSAWFGEEVIGEELEFVWVDGISKTCLWSSRPLRNSEGDIWGVIGILEDITERKHLEKELIQHRNNLEALVNERTLQLTKANERTANILEIINESFLDLDKDWRITYVNKSAEKLLRLPRRALVGRVLWHVFPKYRDEFFANFSKARTKGKKISMERHFLQRWLEFDIYPHAEGLTVLCRDVTESKLAQEDLRLSEQRFAAAFNSSPSMMYITDVEERLVDVNNSFQSITGYAREQVIGLRPADLQLWEIGNGLLPMNHKLSHPHSNIEAKFVTQSGQMRSGLFSSEVIRIGNERLVLVVGNDITELENLRQEMARLDRLNLIGQMAAGISHEVRNPMTTVRGFLQIFGAKPEYNQDKEFLELMINELDRANAIISQFLSISKGKVNQLEVSEFKVVNLNAILDDLYPLISADALNCDKGFELVKGQVPDLSLNKKEIHQLILNLVRNGIEAMPSSGKITITTYKADDHIVLAVKDEGRGIPYEVRGRLGTPFVTTKENGTGLGLAVSYSIASRNNASIEVETGSKGTTFFIRFRLEEQKIEQRTSNSQLAEVSQIENTAC